MVQTIPDFYAGQKVLVTGGTGFMGKVLVEKLLRSCPDVDTIYLIIRSKKGKSIEERWRDLTNLPLFDKLKSLRPNILNKVKLIPGELSRDDLGISADNKQILAENVTIAFHIAADVQFSESINDSIVQNVRSTKILLDFLVTFKQLKVLEYLSTAFSNINRPPAECIEKILPACQDWKSILKLQETEPDTLQPLKEKLLCGHPNPYTWSKSLAEQIVYEYSSYFPIAIIRPAVVMGCIRDDPLVGWTDAINGASAVGLGVYSGVLRVCKATEDCHTDFIPVDLATRAELIAAKVAVERCSRIEVYNCATAAIQPLTMANVLKTTYRIEEKYTFSAKVGPANCYMTLNPYLYQALFLVRQVIPAFFLDLVLKLAGHKPLFKKIAIKTANMDRMFGKFTAMKVTFPIENYIKLEDYVSETDKENFSINITWALDGLFAKIDDMSLGFFRYYLKEDFSEEAMKRNKKRLNRIMLLKKAVMTALYSLFGLIIWKLIEPSSFNFFID